MLAEELRSTDDRNALLQETIGLLHAELDKRTALQESQADLQNHERRTLTRQVSDARTLAELRGKRVAELEEIVAAMKERQMTLLEEKTKTAILRSDDLLYAQEQCSYLQARVHQLEHQHAIDARSPHPRSRATLVHSTPYTSTPTPSQPHTTSSRPPPPSTAVVSSLPATPLSHQPQTSTTPLTRSTSASVLPQWHSRHTPVHPPHSHSPALHQSPKHSASSATLTPTTGGTPTSDDSL